MLPDMLCKIFSLFTNNPGHVSWRAAVLCSFRGFLWKSQVRDSEAALKRGDFRFYDWGMVLIVHHSKTIQFRERLLEIPIVRCADKGLCAVAWTQEHFRQLPAGQGETAFHIPTGGGSSEPLTYKIYQETLELFASMAGLDTELLSSHSLRRGGCTFLHMCGATRGIEGTRGLGIRDSIQLHKDTISLKDCG